MINTGKKFEEIVQMLNNFKSEVQISSTLGLSNINKHSENFLMRILNLTYNLELENLNKKKPNFPGLDLGDEGDGIAYQITATKKSGKIDNTLSTCLKCKHYDTFKTINILILTTKQKNYSLKTITEPFFEFLPKENISDIDDLLKDIEHLEPIKIDALNTYIKAELQPVIEAIRTNKTNQRKLLLDIDKTLVDLKVPKYCLWHAKINLKNSNISAPEIYRKLDSFLPKAALRYKYLGIFNNTFRINQSSKEIFYCENIKKTHATNYFYGNAMLIEKASITIERANYTDGEILYNLLSEMVSLLSSVLFFSSEAKNNFEIEIEIYLKTNTKVYFYPRDSLVLDKSMNSFILDSPFEMETSLNDVHTSTITDLLQEIMNGFISESNSTILDPFVNINRESTDFVINNIKETLGILV